MAATEHADDAMEEDTRKEEEDEDEDEDGVYSDDEDDDDDSDEDEDDEEEEEAEMPDEKTMKAIMKLEESLEDNPAGYTVHAKLVRLLRAAGGLKQRLRDAREAMSARFPLNETQWREWISDEVRDTKGKPTKRGKIVGGLFERATADYLSVPLWLGYAEFSLDQGWDTAQRRQLYERALSVAGQGLTHYLFISQLNFRPFVPEPT